MLAYAAQFVVLKDDSAAILVNPLLRRLKMRRYIESTLLHEMVHVEQWKLPRKQAHGRKFQKRMKQLAAVGAFNGIW